DAGADGSTPGGRPAPTQESAEDSPPGSNGDTMRHSHEEVSHPFLSRRAALQAGSIGLLGLGLKNLSALAAAEEAGQMRPKKSVIFIFLTGGLSHQDSFDLKPDAPD